MASEQAESTALPLQKRRSHDEGTVVHDMLLKIKPKDHNRRVRLPVSALSHHPTVVDFINITGITVLIFWIDYKEQLRKYVTLSNNHRFTCHTFVGHPWVAIGSSNRAQCLINGQFVFTIARHSPLPKEPVAILTVTLPMLTLYSWSIRRVLHSIDKYKALNDPEMLVDLPRQLVEDILEAIRKDIFVGKHVFNDLPFYSWFDLGILSV